jgi:hypothetical protein
MELSGQLQASASEVSVQLKSWIHAVQIRAIHDNGYSCGCHSEEWWYCHGLLHFYWTQLYICRGSITSVSTEVSAFWASNRISRSDQRHVSPFPLSIQRISSLKHELDPSRTVRSIFVYRTNQLTGNHNGCGVWHERMSVWVWNLVSLREQWSLLPCEVFTEGSINTTVTPWRRVVW